MEPPDTKVDYSSLKLYALPMVRATPISAERQTADAVLMIRPAHFGSNAETLGSNYFQNPAPAATDVAAAAQREFGALAAQLGAAGVRVHCFQGQPQALVPDEVFPNNWLSLHADGTAVLYPMMAESRRRERRPELVEALQRQHGYRVERIVDLTHLEQHGQYLEGTGSLVLDRVQRIAYACLSPRTHPDALAQFGSELGYEIVPFRATDRSTNAIYHTNVLMSVGAKFVAICTNAIRDAAERERLLDRLDASGREVIDLSFDQLHAFAGNLLALRAGNREIIALSTTALASLDETQAGALGTYGEVVTADIGTIEKYGGGSVRCMLAEVHLPKT
jgi:hypothetical protein